MIRSGIILVFLAVFLAGPPASSAEQGGVPFPVLAKAQGEKCVAPAEDMRRNHGDYLLHQRDETARLGIRGGKYSLKKCIECHASPDAEAAGAATVRPFCAACHDYAAVSINCFECHTPKASGGNPKP
ncbi:MAG: Hdr-like menaquinol oxidoreductase cytochrome c subunit [Rhodospirillales bacterium]